MVNAGRKIIHTKAIRTNLLFNMLMLSLLISVAFRILRQIPENASIHPIHQTVHRNALGFAGSLPILHLDQTTELHPLLISEGPKNRSLPARCTHTPLSLHYPGKVGHGTLSHTGYGRFRHTAADPQMPQCQVPPAVPAMQKEPVPPCRNVSCRGCVIEPRERFLLHAAFLQQNIISFVRGPHHPDMRCPMQDPVPVSNAPGNRLSGRYSIFINYIKIFHFREHLRSVRSPQSSGTVPVLRTSPAHSRDASHTDP